METGDAESEFYLYLTMSKFASRDFSKGNASIIALE